MNDFISKLDSTLNILFQQYKLDLKNQPVGVLLSGGIDSSTISYYCQKYFQNVTFYSFGVKDNFDKPFAELIKLQFNIQLEYLEIDENMIVNHISKVKELLQQVNIETNLMQISLAMGYFLIFQKIREMNINHIFTGQGPDILLAGYHKYKSLMTSEINATIEQDMPLLEIDGKRDNSMAQNFNITLHNPFLENSFIEICKTIPGDFKLHKEGNNLIEKYILRQLGKKIGLPQEIINRKKKAFQYSTGLQKLVKKLI